MISKKAVLFLVVALVLVAGCETSPNSSVKGKVTYNGKPVAKGFITFFPARGGDNTGKAEIIDGQYHGRDILPGPKRVLIRAYPNARVVAGPNGSRILDVRAPEIPANAPGNNKIVDLPPGDQVIDFHLGKK